MERRLLIELVDKDSVGMTRKVLRMVGSGAILIVIWIIVIAIIVIVIVIVSVVIRR